MDRRALIKAGGAALLTGTLAPESSAANILLAKGHTGAAGEFTNPPGTHGFTRARNSNVLAAVAAFNAGTADVKIPIIGDSNTIGVGAGEDGSGLNIKLHCPVRKLRDKLLASGIAATDDSLWGNANTQDMFGMSYTEPRFTYTGSGWNVAAPDGPVIGGLGFNAGDTTSTWTWQMVDTQTHARISCETSAGFGTLEMTINPGGVVRTIDLNGAGGRPWFTVDLGGEAVHSITFRASTVGNRVIVFAIDPYNVNVRRVRLWCWAYAGGDLSNIVSIPYASYADEGGHLAIINDLLNDRGTLPFPTSLVTTATNALKANNCDVFLENPYPSVPPGYNPAFTSTDFQALAESLNAPLGDHTEAFALGSGIPNPTNADWSAAGYGATPDKHCNNTGYAKITDYRWAAVRQLFGV